MTDPGLRPDAAQQSPRRSFGAAHTIVETTDATAPALLPPVGGATVPGAPAPVLAAAMGPTPAGTPLQPSATTGSRLSGTSPAPGNGRTVPLPLHGGTGEGGAARTVIDVDEPVVSPATPALNRSLRLAIGLIMASGGLVLMLLSSRTLWPSDEAPPPLEAPPVLFSALASPPTLLVLGAFRRLPVASPGPCSYALSKPRTFFVQRSHVVRCHQEISGVLRTQG